MLWALDQARAMITIGSFGIEISTGKRLDGRGQPHAHRSFGLSFDFSVIMLSHVHCSFVAIYGILIPYHKKIILLWFWTIPRGLQVIVAKYGWVYTLFDSKTRFEHNGEIHFLIWDSVFELIPITVIWTQNIEVSTRSERTRRHSQEV